MVSRKEKEEERKQQQRTRQNIDRRSVAVHTHPKSSPQTSKECTMACHHICHRADACSTQWICLMCERPLWIGMCERPLWIGMCERPLWIGMCTWNRGECAHECACQNCTYSLWLSTHVRADIQRSDGSVRVHALHCVGIGSASLDIDGRELRASSHVIGARHDLSCFQATGQALSQSPLASSCQSPPRAMHYCLPFASEFVCRVHHPRLHMVL